MLSAAREDDGLRRRVDAHSERLGGEEDLHEAASEEDLDQLCKQQSDIQCECFELSCVGVVSVRGYRECCELLCVLVPGLDVKECTSAKQPINTLSNLLTRFRSRCEECYVPAP